MTASDADHAALAAQAAITALEAQRGLLGDATVDAAIQALRATLGAPAPTAAPAAQATRPSAPQPAPPPPGAAQRLRQVSVLFVDVAESTRLLRGVDVQDAPAVLDAAVQRFAACVQAEGGLVLRFTGDGLKAAFGTQGTREDEAERAVCAGLAILEAAAAHADHLRQTLRLEGFAVRVGIHTGPVVLGGGAEADRTALGDAVHVAARMEQSAPLGRLRISNDTHAQVRGLFRVEAQPPLQVKGVEEPMHTWLVLGRHDASHTSHADRAPQRGVDGAGTAMVGRDAELAQLQAAWRTCREGPALRVATVLADAGIGKTRLRQELLLRLLQPVPDRSQPDAAARPPTVLQARGHPGGPLQPYGLLRQLLARWLSIADDLDAADARARLLEGLRPWLGGRPGTDVRTDIRTDTRAQALGQLIGLDFSDSPAVGSLGPRELRRTAFAALTEVLHAIAARDGLVLVLDDLHWADAGTLDFIRELARPTTLPLLVVLLARPALRDHCTEPLAEADVVACELNLAPLDAQQGPALATALLAPLADPPPALHRLLVDRADGNPFYMEELLRMLIDDGVIDARQRPWRLQKRWQDTMRVPSTLVGVLQARLDALPADELAALQQASIVGTVFWDSALQAIDDHSPQALPALESRRLVVPRAGSAFVHETEHAFHHQILHDVTYGTVLGAARRAGHAQVARWLAERVTGRAAEFLGITAEHFEKAGDSVQALEYYDRARSDASRRFAHDATLAYAERALRQPALTSPLWRYQIKSACHNTLEAQGRVQEARAMLAEMHALAEAADSDAMRADLCAARMLEADREGHVAEAERLARQAIELAERSDRAGAAALAHGEIAWLATMRHDHEVAQTHVALGIDWARRAAQQPWREGGYAHYELQLRTIGIESLLIRTRWFEAVAAVKDALLHAPADRLHDRVSLYMRLSRAEHGTGDLEAALASARQAQVLAEATDKPTLNCAASSLLALLLNALGRHDEALAAARSAEAVARSIDNAATTSNALGHQARAWRGLGDYAQARQLWQQDEALLATLDVPGDLAETRCELAWLDAAEGRTDAALAAVAAILGGAGGGDIGNGDTVDRGAAEGVAGGTDATDGFAVPTTDICLLRALQVCEMAGDQRRAAAVERVMRARLDRLLAQAPDEAARERLKRLEPWQRVATAPAPSPAGEGHRPNDGPHDSQDARSDTPAGPNE